MRLYIDGAFDMGAVYGVADDAFAQLDRSKALAAAQRVFGNEVELIASVTDAKSPEADDLRTKPSDVQAPFGAGLRFRVFGGALLERWRSDALHFLEISADEMRAEYGQDGLARISGLIRALHIDDVTFFAFGVGVGLVRLRVSNLHAAEPADIHGLFKALEVGGYGESVATPGRHTANALLASFREVLRGLLARTAPSAAATDREPDKELLWLRGFQGLLILENSDPFEPADPRLAPPGYAQSTLPYGPLTVNFTWLMATVRDEPVYENNVPHLIYAMMLARLSWELTHLSQAQFQTMIRRRLAASLSRTTFRRLKPGELNIFKNLAGAIVSMTTLSSVSAFSGDVGLFKKYDEFAGVAQRHLSIRDASAAFAAAEEEEITQSEARRARALNSLLSILTIVSLGGVSASVISAWTDGVELFGDKTIFLTTLIAPAALGAAAFLIANRTRGR